MPIRFATQLLRLVLALLLPALVARPAGAQQRGASRPNLVWIVLDDASPDLGAYGDALARTPHMDRLAREGVRFTHAFTHAPVCAPSRSGLVTGMYPTSIGTHHMRSQLLRPPEILPQLLRRAGYRVLWPGKTDFNFEVPADAFDSTQPWLEQAEAPRGPFFAYLNLGATHESRVRMRGEEFARQTARLRPEERHDPARVVVPPYYPDTPEVRRDLANYHDLMTVADHQVGEVLARLQAWGVADNTVVLLFGDHGRGMPRHKRWVYDSGTRVPLIVRWPEHLRGGRADSSLVSFVDFAPTMLALAGAPVPERMQGHVFLHPDGRIGTPREYVFAARDRMDETYDRIRSVRDARFQYIRNFHPELPYAQRIAYNEENPTMRVWRERAAAGALTGVAALFFAPGKPPEELYDTRSDPFQVRNLAGDAAHARVLARLRAALDRWMVVTGDLGGIPERELIRRGLVADVLALYEERRLP